VERKSTFQAHMARVGSRAQIEWFMSALLSVGKLARATHNISAYRFIDNARAGMQVAKYES
jgi:putative IMPACT (imprinted ancient) family translation regulator